MERHAASGLADALARVGDRWTLLVVEVLLDAPRRFNELFADVPGIASNVLSDRLRELERAGLVLARPYSERPRRFLYELTSAGEELAGALRLLARWGEEQAGAEAESPRHARCGSPLEARWYCATCGTAVAGDEATEGYLV